MAIILEITTTKILIPLLNVDVYLIKALPQENETDLYAKTKELQRNFKGLSLEIHWTNISA